jgi:hypothetical protein
MPNMPTGAKLFDVVLVASAIAIMLAVHLS